ncbi:restriction endonuclease subunit S [Tritonibacter mobilis]|uniref:restriction endonuclease subunit S n=1 Tax=Tritonibacter mobilis TaxID=379347 RepID=UPI0014025DD7|nr:restriction endonuclease subunit S [Tritonibacter mobilis]NHM17221.1 hypothetical protein [Tritonibacter mobilis]NHM21409.1 hypothetical protein [Tritonibacter mobilis]
MKVDSLPANWASFKLSEIAAGAGQSVAPKNYPQETFDLFSVPAFENRVPDQPLGEEIKSNKQSVEPGNVLLCKIVPHLNRVWTVPEKATNRQIASGEWVRYDTAGLDPEYVRLALSSPEFRDEFMTTISGVGGSLTRARPQMFNQFDIPLPPLAEQKRIVEKLDQLSARIRAAKDHLTHVQTLATRAKQATLAAAFDSGFDTLELGELAQEIRYGTSKKCGYDLGSTPVLRIPNVAGGKINSADLKSADFDSKEIDKLSLMAGDLLLIRSNGSIDLVGRSALVGEEHTGYLYAGYLIRVRLDHERARPEYVQQVLASVASREFIERLAKSTSGVNNINSAQIASIPVPLPPLEEQTEIVRRIETAFARIDRMVAEATKALALLERLEAQLLAKAFRGELVPQDPNDEPASALLARIRDARANAPKPKRARQSAKA